MFDYYKIINATLGYTPGDAAHMAVLRRNIFTLACDDIFEAGISML